MMDLVIFYIFAGITVLASIGVVSARSPMHSVMLLIYAGAIMVLFLFVVMLLNAHTEEEVIPARLGPHALRLAVLLSLVLAFELVKAIMLLTSEQFSTDAATIAHISSVSNIGSKLYSTNGYAFAFEVTSILILVSMVGALVIARRPRKER
jgi:NADH-quinone oxidoreductase subunit J